MQMQQLNLFDMPEESLPVKYYFDFLAGPEANELFQYCKTLEWKQNKIKMLGRPMQIPRLECMYGKKGAHYQYSGSVNLVASPWTQELLEIRDRITAYCNHQFDIVVGNLYRNGQDHIGWHSDNDPSMGHSPVIASISLGACRKFSIKSKIKGSKPTHFWLEHGSLLLMMPGCQEKFVHQLPQSNLSQSNYAEERINLTFRPYQKI